MGQNACMTASTNYNRLALAACFDTFIEWYDFLTFATLAVHFTVLFFPADDPVSGLLYSLATFGVGMVVRPLGAALFGSLGDRLGRKHVFIATIGIMGVATFLVGLLPTFAQWGWWSAALLLTLRLAQGLAMDGWPGNFGLDRSNHRPAVLAESRGVRQLGMACALLVVGRVVVGQCQSEIGFAGIAGF